MGREILKPAMSQENVEIVRKLAETAGVHLDAGLEFLAPDIELHLSGVFPDLDPVYRGHEGVRRFAALFIAPWEELSLNAERFFDLGERILTLSRFEARGRDGIEVNLEMAHVWTLRGGQVIRMDAFADRGEAVEAAGLEE